MSIFPHLPSLCFGEISKSTSLQKENKHTQESLRILFHFGQHKKRIDIRIRKSILFVSIFFFTYWTFTQILTNTFNFHKYSLHKMFLYFLNSWVWGTCFMKELPSNIDLLFVRRCASLCLSGEIIKFPVIPYISLAVPSSGVYIRRSHIFSILRLRFYNFINRLMHLTSQMFWCDNEYTAYFGIFHREPSTQINSSWEECS